MDMFPTIQVGMGESQTIKTMIHEVAHAMLHNSDFMKQNGEEKDRLTKETEAESIAFTVCSALGIDTSDYSKSENLVLVTLLQSQRQERPHFTMWTKKHW